MSGDRHDVAFASLKLSQLPLGNLGVRSGLSGNESAERHDKLSALDGDEHPSVSDLVFRRGFDKSWQGLQRVNSPQGYSGRAIKLDQRSYCKARYSPSAVAA